MCMISYLAVNSYVSNACFLGVVFAISCVVVILTNKSLFDVTKLDQSIFNDGEEPVALEEEIGGH